jgi:anhydro-N-acetylmuramic acid kinase
VRHWLQQDYFKSELSPKSLDRDKYQYVKDDIPDLNLKDGAATLAAFTAEAIALMLRKITTPLHAVIVCGGGAYNKAILANLANALPHVKVQTATSVGWQSDAIEAQAFGYLAVRTIHNLPITFPTTTGVQQPLCGGEIVFP